MGQQNDRRRQNNRRDDRGDFSNKEERTIMANRNRMAKQDKLRNRSRSRDRMPRSGDQDNEPGVRDKVFVGGLDYALTDSEFAMHFGQFG